MSWPSWLNSSSSPQPKSESDGNHASIWGGGQASPPSAPVGTSIQVASGGWGHVVPDLEASPTTASSGSSSHQSSSSSKRKRDDEPPPAAVARSSSAPSAQSIAASTRDAAIIDGMMDVDEEMDANDGPASKKSRGAAPAREISPPQSYTRGKYRVTHHKVFPSEQKAPSLFSTGKGQPERRWGGGTKKDNRSLSRGQRQHGRVSRRSSAPSDMSRYSGLSVRGEFSQISASRFSSPAAAGSSSSSTTEGSALSVGGGAAGGSAAAGDDEDGSSNSSAAAGGSPPLVVIDGSNTAFAYREGDGRWRAEGPLLAIQVPTAVDRQYFEDRGVETVAFIPRQRIDSVSPQDDVYPALQAARASGAISLVPSGGNDDLYFLKYAIDRNAPVVSNDRFRDHAADNERLAALGRTRAELSEYLAENQVGFTFARNEFVPNPEARVIKDLARHASNKRASRSHEAPGASSDHASPEPLQRRRESERDSQKTPIPPLQAHERYERGYLFSEQSPP